MGMASNFLGKDYLPGSGLVEVYVNFLLFVSQLGFSPLFFLVGRVPVLK